MNALSALRNAGVVLVLCAATAIVSTAQTFTTLVDFDGKDGQHPTSPISQGADGLLYGATDISLYKVTRAGLLAHLPLYTANNSGVILATDGEYYGVSATDGASGDGYIFKGTSNGILMILHSFDGADGDVPAAPLAQGSDGNFYGTTAYGGAGNSCFDGCGTVFTVNPTGVLTTLYSFCVQPSCPVGPHPSGLIQASDGNFYGTTFEGGNSSCNPYSCGTVFSITPQGTFTTLYSFHGFDGGNPIGGVIQALDGNFYGTTSYGGQFGGGTVYKMTSNGVLTTLYNFDGTDGAIPQSGLIQATDGNLYGTTFSGGEQNCNPYSGCGTVFEMTPSGTLMTLYTFDQTDGGNPYAPLLQATDGSFYGTTYLGGIHNNGTIFSLSTGLGAFVRLVGNPATVGQGFGILGQGLTGTMNVYLNGKAARHAVRSDTLVVATVPRGATTGYVTVTTPSGTLTSNVPFRVIP